ncbi:MAG: hypothetical protein JWM27_3858, partial [Gemmatimonadetes bacterium]|nr:hypothetical protein [Gemmatimonadota bacterium]
AATGGGAAVGPRGGGSGGAGRPSAAEPAEKS